MFYSITRLLRQIRRRRELGIAFLFAVLMLCVVGNTITFYLFDRVAKPDLSFWDAAWYSVISITTIGYGDLSASTLGARAGTIFFIIVVGLAAFTTTVGVTVDWIVDLRYKERTGMGKVSARDHLIIVNFPSASRVRESIDEFLRDELYQDREIVIVTDQIDELPFSIDNVSFVRGSPLQEETLERAAVHDAWQAMIMSTSYDDLRTDSYVASESFLIQRMNPELKVVAECFDSKHAVLFNESPNLSIVYGMKAAIGLMVQTAQDPGVHLVTHAILSNVTEIEETFRSTLVSDASQNGLSYTEISKTLLDHGVNLIAVVRNKEGLLGIEDLDLAEDDTLVYIAKKRRTWDELRSNLMSKA